MPKAQKKIETINGKVNKKNQQSFKYVTGVVMGATVGAVAGFVMHSLFNGKKDGKITEILDSAKNIGERTLGEIQKKTDELQTSVQKAQSRFVQS